MNKLDGLFRDKLTDYSVSPSNESWRKVEAGLPKKNNVNVWLKIAACLLLATVSGIVVESSKPTEKNLISKLPKQFAPSLKTHSQPAIESILQEKLEAKKTGNTTRVTSKKDIEQDQSEPSRSEVLSVATKLEFDTVLVQDSLDKNAALSVASVIEKPIVIEYTLDPVENDVKEVSSKSTFRKMVDFAIEAKNGDGAIIGLRQAKEDLFALNFKKDKTKNSKN